MPPSSLSAANKPAAIAHKPRAARAYSHSSITPRANGENGSGNSDTLAVPLHLRIDANDTKTSTPRTVVVVVALRHFSAQKVFLVTL